MHWQWAAEQRQVAMDRRRERAQVRAFLFMKECSVLQVRQDYRMRRLLAGVPSLMRQVEVQLARLKGYLW